MNNVEIHRDMLVRVAKALGDNLLKEVVFVGGCTTSLLLTDEVTLDEVRHTDDVDLIVKLSGFVEFSRLQSRLRSQGFSECLDDGGAPICAMRLGELRVDFMPTDESILGFSNRWYTDALNTAQPYPLEENLVIRLINPVYFVATKLEAYRGRGANDPLTSHDIEDLLNIFDGRPEILEELSKASKDVRDDVAAQLEELLQDGQFEYAISDCVRGDKGREDVLIERIEHAAGTSAS